MTKSGSEHESDFCSVSSNCVFYLSVYIVIFFLRVRHNVIGKKKKEGCYRVFGDLVVRYGVGETLYIL